MSEFRCRHPVHDVLIIDIMFKHISLLVERTAHVLNSEHLQGCNLAARSPSWTGRNQTQKQTIEDDNEIPSLSGRRIILWHEGNRNFLCKPSNTAHSPSLHRAVGLGEQSKCHRGHRAPPSACPMSPCPWPPRNEARLRTCHTNVSILSARSSAYATGPFNFVYNI